jgi:hypothetical protein
MVMHPHTKYHRPISRQKCYGPDKKILFKKQLFDLEVKDQGPTKVITVHYTPPYGHAYTNYLSMNSFVGFIWPLGQSHTKVITVRDTPLYGHAPTYQLSLTYLERQKCYGPDKKILVKKQLFDLEVKGQGPMNVITVHDTPPYGHAPHTKYHWPISKDKKVMVWTSFAEKKRKKQKKLELWVTSLSDTPHLQYYDVQTLEYRYISKLPMKNERIWSYVKETTSHLQN